MLSFSPFRIPRRFSRFAVSSGARARWREGVGEKKGKKRARDLGPLEPEIAIWGARMTRESGADNRRKTVRRGRACQGASDPNPGLGIPERRARGTSTRADGPAGARAEREKLVYLPPPSSSSLFSSDARGSVAGTRRRMQRRSALSSPSPPSSLSPLALRRKG